VERKVTDQLACAGQVFVFGNLSNKLSVESKSRGLIFFPEGVSSSPQPRPITARSGMGHAVSWQRHSKDAALDRRLVPDLPVRLCVEQPLDQLIVSFVS